MPLGAPPSKLPHFSQLSVLRASPVYTNSLTGYKDSVNNLSVKLLRLMEIHTYVAEKCRARYKKHVFSLPKVKFFLEAEH